MSLPYFEFRPAALAHRGFSRDGLENSMAAFRAAVNLGCRYLETDVHTTSDGVPHLFHDRTLERVTGSPGRISGLTAAQVAEARIGGTEPVPRLDALLLELPDALLNLDIKDWNSVEAVAAVIERHQAHHQVLVTSFSDRRRRAVLKRLSRPVASSAGLGLSAVFTLLGPVLPGPLFRRVMPRLLSDVHALQVPVRYGPIHVATAGFIRRAHSLGLVVHCWTINDLAEMRRLLDLGVDGIVTDRADLLRDVLVERGQWPECRPGT